MSYNEPDCFEYFSALKTLQINCVWDPVLPMFKIYLKSVNFKSKSRIIKHYLIAESDIKSILSAWKRSGSLII